MKIIYPILFILLVLTTSSCDTSETIVPKNKVFIKLYGSDGNQYGVDLLQFDESENKDLIILATVEAGLTNHFMLVRVDTMGKQLLSYEFFDDDQSSSENAVAMAFDGNNNIYVFGTKVMSNAIDNSLFIYKISPTGQIIDKRLFEIELPYGDNSVTKAKRIDIAQDIIAFTNNTFVVSGYSKASQNTPEEFFSFRFDENLNLLELNRELWEYSDFENQEPFSRLESKILRLNEDEVIAFVTSNNKNEFSPDGFNVERLVLNKLNDPGLEFKDSGTDFNDRVAGAVKTNNGFAYVATVQKSTGNSILIGQFNSSGTSMIGLEKEWASRNLKAKAINQQTPGRLLILGEETITADNHNIYLAEIEGDRLVWEQSYGGSEIDQAAELLVDGNSIYVLGTLEFDDQLNSQNKILLIKTDNTGRL